MKMHNKLKSIKTHGLLGIIVAIGLAGCTTTEAPRVAGPVAPYSKEDRFPIVVKGGKAYTQKCGYWPKDLSGDFYNRPYPSFGCSTQNNLAAMLEKPNDANGMRKSTRSNGARSAAAIEKYSKGEAVGSSASGSESGGSTTGSTN